MTLNTSTVSGNTSAAAGGGIFVGNARYSANFLTLNSSTVSGNTAVFGGGGIYSLKRAELRNSTIAGNEAGFGGGGGIFIGDGPLIIVNTIIAANTAGGDLQHFAGTLTVSFSLIGDNAGTSLVESQTPDANGNLIGSSAGSGKIDPLLAPLADNGNFTQTHALLAGSPALDAIPYYVGPTPAHDYQLNGSLSDLLGGPSLVALGGNLTATGYDFGLNQGLNLSSAIANPAQYSLELIFKWNSLFGGWQKIIDFHNLTSDVGLYTAGTGLHFLNDAFTSSLFAANTFYHLVLTRDDATDIVRGYMNGAEVWNFVDSAGNAVLDGPNQIIRFFQDDATTGQTQAQSGSVDRIRIYNQVLSAADVTTIYNAPAAPFPDFDQRGAPFGRIVGGDGVNGPQVDMGAYEFDEVFNAPPVFTSPTTASVPENTTAVLIVTATDADLPPQPLTFTIFGGADQARFSMTPAGVLSYVVAPNFEAPTDANGNNVYVVTVQASDGAGGTATQTLNVTVTAVNDNNPVITSSDVPSVPETTTAVLTVTATDADLPAQPITFSIVGGADQAKFGITSGGVLSFNSVPDFESPTDSNGDNIYVVVVQASDGGLTGIQAILVTVTNVFEGLLGDYNLNNTVDAVDYVVWRNTLGTNVTPFSGADGSGNGIIDQADRLVWMANFGRILPGAGSGEMVEEAPNLSVVPTLAVMSDEQKPATSLAFAAAPTDGGLAKSVTAVVPRIGVPGEFLFQTVVTREKPASPINRIASITNPSRDDALAAWLATSSAGSEPEISGIEFWELSDERDDRRSTNEIVDAIDRALELVAI